MRKKVLIIGPAGSGKTQILHKIGFGEFTSSYIPTIGIDFIEKYVPIMESTIQFYEVGGTSIHNFITFAPVFSDIDLAILVCDTFDVKAALLFNSIKIALRQLNHRAINTLIVRNKMDSFPLEIDELDNLTQFALIHQSPFFPMRMSDATDFECFESILYEMLSRNEIEVAEMTTCIDSPISNYF